MLLINNSGKMNRTEKVQVSDTTMLHKAAAACYKIIIPFFILLLFGLICPAQKHQFTLSKTDFLLDGKPVLDILVEGMGHTNFAQFMIDRKGITDRVTLNGMTLMNWEIYPLPMDGNYVTQSAQSDRGYDDKNGKFFKGHFTLVTAGDTYFDLSNYSKGMVYVNGHNLGRHWNIGPQQHLYCPATWLKTGVNEIIIFDLLQQDAKEIKGVKTLE